MSNKRPVDVLQHYLEVTNGRIHFDKIGSQFRGSVRDRFNRQEYVTIGSTLLEVMARIVQWVEEEA